MRTTSRGGRAAALSLLRIEDGKDLIVLREPVLLPLGEGEPPVHDDLEDAATGWDQLRRDPVTVPDACRQTGGAWFVVSDPAVLDRDFHADLLAGRGPQPPAGSRRHL
jgi:hypothetical protein